MDDVKLAQVIIDARDKNGWHVLGAISYPAAAGRRPGGVIAFVDPHKAKLRREMGLPTEICGGAQFYIREDLETVFWGGHYDISRADAMDYLAERGTAHHRAEAA